MVRPHRTCYPDAVNPAASCVLYTRAMHDPTARAALPQGHLATWQGHRLP